MLLHRLPSVIVPCILLAASLSAQTPSQTATVAQPPTHRNVIIFVADGLRRGSVNAEEMPAFARIRREGTDFRNSHSVFPTFTTANASAIATGHGLGDTGDFSNVIWPGSWLGQPNVVAATGSLSPFLEADDILADLNAQYSGNYLGEETLLSAARRAGYSVASVGKLGPTAIQQIDLVQRDVTGEMAIPDGIIIDEATGLPTGVPLPVDLNVDLFNSGLPAQTPLRSNGFIPTSPWNNGFSGDAQTPGTRAANVVLQDWQADVTTKFLLPRFEEEKKPFVLLFWSRDPDGTQHNQGDSLQLLSPGINGPTVSLALRNANHSLQQLLDYLDAHPSLKANTDVFLTSDHGFATVSRRELDRNGMVTSAPSAQLTFDATREKPEPTGTLPTGFLATDLALYTHQRLFDPAVRATTGDSVYAPVALNGDAAHHPLTGSGLIGPAIHHLDGSDARLIVAANGGSDLVYVPSKDPAIVRQALDVITGLDYVGGLFVDDAYCPTTTACPGALPLSAVGLKGSTSLPTPAIVVSFKVFDREAGDIQTAIQVSDTSLQEGQGMHGGLGRDSTWNNMAAIGPDFRKGFVDESPVGNVDIAPTLASILGLHIVPHGTLTGRVLTEAMASGKVNPKGEPKVLISAPTSDGHVTVLDTQMLDGKSYYDRACFVIQTKSGAAPRCDD